MKTKPKYALIKYSGSMVATMAISQWVNLDPKMWQMLNSNMWENHLDFQKYSIIRRTVYI